MSVNQPEFIIPSELFDALCNPPVLKEMKRTHRRVMLCSAGLLACSAAFSVLAYRELVKYNAEQS